jgi:hypothetical protein
LYREKSGNPVRQLYILKQTRTNDIHLPCEWAM